MKDFRNKIAYIVGGSSGIGLATARLLFEYGAHITIFSRDEQKLTRAMKEISEHHALTEQTVAWMQMDVADRSAVEQVLETSVRRHGIPDILINCAGRAYPHYFEDISYEQFDETMKINFYGIWHTTKKLAPLMKEKGGYIVNVSSIAGFLGVFGFTDYSASKFAIMGFSEALRSELKPFNIMVSVLCPPDTNTPALEVENKTKPEETKAISENEKHNSRTAITVEAAHYYPWFRGQNDLSCKTIGSLTRGTGYGQDYPTSSKEWPTLIYKAKSV